eukprot:g5016.t1
MKLIREQFLALLCALLALSVHCSTDGEAGEHEEDEEAGNRIKVYVAIIVVTAIIIISVSFENLKDILEEKTKENLKPVLRSIYGEVTILGFVGLLMFLATKTLKERLDYLCGNNETGWFKSECFTHEDELVCPENPILELTETAHMILFAVMVLFLSCTVLLIVISNQRMQYWNLCEDYCVTRTISHAKLKYRQTSAARKRLGIFGKLSVCRFCSRRVRENVDAKARLEYMGIRIAFIKSHNEGHAANSDHSLDANFDFAHYMSGMLAERLTEMVEISSGNWLFIWVVFIIFLFITLFDVVKHAEDSVLTVASVVAAYLLSGLVYVIRDRFLWVQSHLINASHLTDDNPVLRGERNQTRVDNGIQQPLLPVAHPGSITSEDVARALEKEPHKPLYKYDLAGNLKPSPKTKRGGCCGKAHQPNAHEALFPLGKDGPEIITSFVRVVLVLIALYLGIILLPLRSEIIAYFEGESEWGIGGPALVFLVAFFPIIIILDELAELVPTIAITTSVEMMIHSKGVLRTLRMMKSRQALRVLHNISCFMHYIDERATLVKSQAFQVQTFAVLNEEEKQAVMAECDLISYKAGETVLREGEHNSMLFIITEGSANVLVNGSCVDSMAVGREFGEISMVAGTACMATIEAGDSGLACLSMKKATFDKYLKGKSKQREEMIAAAARATVKKKATVQTPSRSTSPLNINLNAGSGGKRRKTLAELRQKREDEAVTIYRRAALADTFQSIDDDGSGEIDESELCDYLSNLFPGESLDNEMRDQQIKQAIAQLDDDGDGTVTLDEFIKMMEPIIIQQEAQEDPEEVATRMFQILDVDGGGTVTTTEFRDVLKTVGIEMSYEEIRELFHEYDDDLDGLIDSEEFVHMMMHQL